MKKTLAIILAAALAMTAMSGCSAKKSKLDTIKEAGVITMATSPDFAPMEFQYVDANGNNVYAGSDIELGKYIAEKLGVELKIEAMDFTAVQAAVTTGTVDMAISGFAKTEERAESMELSDYYNMDDEDSIGQGILILKDKADQLKTAEDFAGLKVGAQNGSLQYNLVSEQLPSDVTIEPIGSLNDGVLSLTTGKIDALAVSGENGVLYAGNYDEICMSDFFFDYSSEGNVLACTKGETELMEAINEIIKEVNEQKLYSQWSDEATALAESLGIE
ncbi:MAG: transporter substrate-binding domain-containing protein [Oscillospiraceae bacterium]|nr:transporter substrate-binding domain-containing protein [Oscillospiraceae bacterium]